MLGTFLPDIPLKVPAEVVEFAAAQLARSSHVHPRRG
jgi:hypothetical protein